MMKSKPRLLVVEDNAPLIESLKNWLEKKYIVDTAGTGQLAISMGTKENYQLIILDLGLPDISGQEVCTNLREASVQTPILVLTANEELSTKIALLDGGADDYVLKPFYIGELQARLRALERRREVRKALPKEPLVVGDLRLNPGSHRVTRAGKALQVRRKDFEILEYMMRNKGLLLTRSMIINNIWDDSTDRWNNTVDVHIKLLRDTIDRPFKQKLIKTVYGSGYVIDEND